MKIRPVVTELFLADWQTDGRTGRQTDRQTDKTKPIISFCHFANDSTYVYFQITANKTQRFIYLFIFTDALHVSGGSSAHHQEHITVHTASGIVNQYCC